MKRTWCAALPVLLWLSGPGFSLHEVSYGPQQLQKGDLVKPDGNTPRGVVMLIHGGFWKSAYDRSLMIKIADDLVSRNFCVWNVDYRSVGSGGGFPETFQDLSLALGWLGSAEASQLLGRLPVAIVGHSAGGHLATWLGMQAGLEEAMFQAKNHEVMPKLVISQAGVVDLVAAYEANLGQGAVRDFLGSSVPSTTSQLLAASRGAFLDLLLGPAADAAERFAEADPKQLLRRVALEKMQKCHGRLPTIVLVHGQQDLIVPVEQSANFHAAFLETLPELGASKCTLKEVPGEAHFEHLQPESKVWTAAVDSLMTL